MNGLLVVGDVRLHSVFLERASSNLGIERPSEFGGDKRQIDGWIYGGAHMVADIIHLALFDLVPGSNARPLFLSYTPPDVYEHDKRQDWWDYSWTLDQIKDRSALKDPQKRYQDQPGAWAPLFPDKKYMGFYRRELFDATAVDVSLTKDGLPLPAEGSIDYNDIDLLVIDDLDKCFRKWTASNPIYINIIDRVLKSLRNKINDLDAPRLQPLILISLKELPPTNKDEARKRSGELEEFTYWRRILGDDQLRLRTIVVLDAENLRRDGFDISESLSWEQTAQDFIDELQKNNRLSDLRKIGHLIVRFGSAGVLYVRREQHDWSSRLLFIPDRDDRWRDRPDYGVILGYSAILSAALVRSLWSACDEAKGKPFVNRLPEAIEDGLIHGLRACNYLCNKGYGGHPDESPFCRVRLVPYQNQTKEWTGGIPRDLFIRTLPIDQYREYRRVARDKLPAVDSFRDTNVASTPIYAPPTPLWSILSHSCRNRVSKTAVEIAIHGVDKILNQPTWSPRRVASELFLILTGGRFLKRWNDLLDTWEMHYKTVPIENWMPDHEPVRRLLNSVTKALFEVHALKNRPHALQLQIEREFTFKVSDNQIQRMRWARAFNEKFADRQSVANQLRFSLETINRDEVRQLTSELIDDLSRVFEEVLSPIDSPIARYGENGEMIVIDRREIEGYRTLGNLIQSHLEQIKRARHARPVLGQQGVERPLSIALFGPPGAGKSFAIKQILAHIRQDLETVPINVNLSEFTEVRQLAEKFKEINGEIAKKTVPVVFFDEFDAAFGGVTLGWLKSFLAPMEDGIYQGSTVREAVFVFAGGTSSTFGEFSRHSRMRSDPLWIEFAQAKGPDFVSRLHGHVDLMGVNPAGPDDDLYLIRRAVFLRSTLMRILNLKTDQPTRINRDLLYALLHASSYRHGGRSMRIILDLCHRNGEVRKSTIPSVAQLDMHVDGKAFMDLVTRGANMEDME